MGGSGEMSEDKGESIEGNGEACVDVLQSNASNATKGGILRGSWSWIREEGVTDGFWSWDGHTDHGMVCRRTL